MGLKIEKLVSVIAPDAPRQPQRRVISYLDAVRSEMGGLRGVPDEDERSILGPYW